MKRLTEVAHAAIAATLAPGDIAVDATAGNGHDSEFLARRVGADGRVIAFDVQQAALEATRHRLAQSGLGGRVTLVNACHSTLAEHVAGLAPQGIQAAMFNLGFLPGGDKALTSQPVTTVAAIVAALRLLGETGIASIMAYRGHAGGQKETRSVAEYIGQLSASDFAAERFDAPGDGPVLWLIRPRRRGHP